MLAKSPVPAWLKAVALAVVAAYPAAVGWLLLTPHAWQVNRLNVHIWITLLSPVGLHRVISPEQFAVVANVILFVPLVWALWILRRHWIWVAGVLALSCAVEMYQAFIGSRDSTIIDIIANTLGAFLGAALGELTRHYASPRLSHASEADGVPLDPNGSPTHEKHRDGSVRGRAESRGGHD